MSVNVNMDMMGTELARAHGETLPLPQASWERLHHPLKTDGLKKKNHTFKGSRTYGHNLKECVSICLWDLTLPLTKQ